MVLAIESAMASKGAAEWKSPKGITEEQRWNNIDRIQTKAGDRILSVSKPLVEEALEVLTPKQPGSPEELKSNRKSLAEQSKMTSDQAVAILSASAQIEEPIRTTVLNSEQGTIYTFIPRRSVLSQESNAK